jgi:2,4-dienoyl-CoA reductase-like NADH-dependent reductase (Old Yellow Enzyme family)/thioredoxin reductase
MYEQTLSPIRIGRVELKNRVVRTGHVTMFSRTGHITDDLIAYHLARARGGVGLSILEAAAVHRSSVLALANVDDSIIESYRKITRTIAPTGMKLFQQLWHGGHIYPQPDGSPPVSPSNVPSPNAGVAPRAMSGAEIRELIAAYASAARRCEDGGLDGLEVHAGHGYLIMQFLSPVLNRRDDEFGGPFSGRVRFLVEILRAIRGAVSSGFPVGVRLSNSSVPQVLSVEEVARTAALLEAERLIDYVNISFGDYYSTWHQVAGMDQPTGYQLPVTARAVAGSKVPRLVTGRFRTLEEVEQVLRSGEADLVSMVRAHIADPEIVSKTVAGHPERVRPCIACNQGCIGGAATVGRMGCVVNAAVGREESLDEHLIRRADRPLRVMIVGGGPAGMEAARVAALIGHQVVLAEAAARLGGAIEWCKRAPKLQTVGDIGHWLEQEIYRLGVDVRLSTYVDEQDVVAESPDCVIVATGASLDPSLLQVQVPVHQVDTDQSARVISSIDLLSDRRRDWGQSALVVDEVGHYEAIACAEYLLELGVDVTYLTRHPMFAIGIQPTLRVEAALERLYAGGKFRVVTAGQVVKIAAGTAKVKPIRGETSEVIPAETVVWVGIRKGSDELYRKLRTRGIAATCIGDAVAARTLQAAIAEGNAAARNIPLSGFAPFRTG